MWVFVVMVLLSGLAIQYQYHKKDKALVKFYKTRLDEANQKLARLNKTGTPSHLRGLPEDSPR